MISLLLAALCSVAPSGPTPDVFELLKSRGVGVDAAAASRVSAEAVVRLADPGALFFDSAGAAAFESSQSGAVTNPPVLQELGEGIVLLKPDMIHEAVASLVASGLVRAAAAGGGLIMDCRGAGGTRLAAVDAIAAHFNETDVFLYAVQNQAGEDLELHAAPPGPRAEAPVLMLVDRRTSGAAELLAAVLSRSRGVMLVGEPTRGDTTRRELADLSENHRVLLATGRFVLPDGSSWEGKGVMPHVLAPIGEGQRPEIRTNGVSRAGRVLDETAKRHLELFARVRQDPALGRAVDLLLGLKAMAILPEKPHAPSVAETH
jgi:hypothetical protein